MCAKRNKEKELTLREALEMARKELTPRWHLSPPLIAGIINEGKISVVPLNDSFPKQDWVMLFVDPTDYSGHAALWFFKELLDRYGTFSISPLIIFHEAYTSFRKREVVTKFMESLEVQVPYVIDWDGLISKAFQLRDSPGFVFWKQNILRIRHSGPQWFLNLESELQAVLREADPGLPLWLPFPAHQLPFVSRGKLDFGMGRGIHYTGPGFKQKHEEAPWIAQYFPTDAPIATSIGPMRLVGNWTLDQDRLMTKDSDASISFKSPAASFGIFAQPMGKADDHATLEIDLNEVPIPDVFSGTELIYDDEGRSIVRIKSLALYQVAAHLPDQEREIRIRFPYASHTAVAIYGLRFAD